MKRYPPPMERSLGALERTYSDLKEGKEGRGGTRRSSWGWLKCSLKIATSLPQTMIEHLLDVRHSMLDFERQKCIRCNSYPQGAFKEKTEENRKFSFSKLGKPKMTSEKRRTRPLPRLL